MTCYALILTLGLSWPIHPARWINSCGWVNTVVMVES